MEAELRAMTPVELLGQVNAEATITRLKAIKEEAMRRGMVGAFERLKRDLLRPLGPVEAHENPSFRDLQT